jgi:hypothetical protein
VERYISHISWRARWHQGRAFRGDFVAAAWIVFLLDVDVSLGDVRGKWDKVCRSLE